MNKGGAFFLGGLIGLAAGIFLAPKSGEENRADAKEFAYDLLGKSQGYYQRGSDRVQSRVSTLRSEAADKGDQLQAKIDAARKIISEQVAKNAEAAKKAAESAAAVEVEAQPAEQSPDEPDQTKESSEPEK